MAPQVKHLAMAACLATALTASPRLPRFQNVAIVFLCRFGIYFGVALILGCLWSWVLYPNFFSRLKRVPKVNVRFIMCWGPMAMFIRVRTNGDFHGCYDNRALKNS